MSSAEEEEPSYAVEYIVKAKVAQPALKVTSKKWIYYVKWVGYPHSDNTWEPYDHFNSKKPIKSFWKHASEQEDEDNLWGVGHVVWNKKKVAMNWSSDDLDESPSPPSKTSADPYVQYIRRAQADALDSGSSSDDNDSKRSPPKLRRLKRKRSSDTVSNQWLVSDDLGVLTSTSSLAVASYPI
ncbi:hypothetical protein SISNIDRAFT_50845 [Sistotremastrum niveocremeum HHB9708]|uniref:Chromo domain-containing protein n=2 Tax=Sistotremastraceae TaxID=3402574 RepID=A0A164VZQ2_9AGAM|nr:hypothetical protein SISNIDRAFT_50845 [Sistotremastrum niveocremeum HHB9708]KZT37759.1 hypothetical protein SISSUDRAFT_825779 [Sistotremastrum suecicum HHB10207 ss-3]